MHDYKHLPRNTDCHAPNHRQAPRATWAIGAGVVGYPNEILNVLAIVAAILDPFFLDLVQVELFDGCYMYKINLILELNFIIELLFIQIVLLPCRAMRLLFVGIFNGFCRRRGGATLLAAIEHSSALCAQIALLATVGFSMLI